MNYNNKVKDVLFGIAIGDALGVPFEFKERKSLEESPIKEMIGFGTHNQPPGTWSDDSSLTFCLTESLCEGYNLQDIANKFVKWYYENYWTPLGTVFDIGFTTSKSIERLKRGISPLVSGELDEDSNGNGSLMRILPLSFLIKNMSVDEKYKIIKEVSAITHAHIRSVLSCFIYIEYAINLLDGLDKTYAYEVTKNTINTFFSTSNIIFSELNRFNRIIKHNIVDYSREEIYSSGYVIHTLEACFWCILRNDNYKSTVLEAVNLGYDTDTIGAIVGGLAGIIYGIEQIPKVWIDILVKKNEILILAEKYTSFLNKKS